MKSASLRATSGLLMPLLLTVFVGTAVAQDKPASTEVDGKIDWVFDLDEGRRISQELDKPVFIVFRCER
jgi:hypothetical protein